jgi:hypothetical protein
MSWGKDPWARYGLYHRKPLKKEEKDRKVVLSWSYLFTLLKTLISVRLKVD